jgi:putative hemolysin
LAEPLVPLLDFLGGAANAVAIALVTVVLTFLTLVFGELAPKRLAMQNALRWAMLVARPLDALSTMSRPAVWALSGSTNLVVRLFGGKPDAESAQMSASGFPPNSRTTRFVEPLNAHTAGRRVRADVAGGAA